MSPVRNIRYGLTLHDYCMGAAKRKFIDYKMRLAVREDF